MFLLCFFWVEGYAQTPSDEEYKEWAKYLWQDERTKEEILADFENYHRNFQKKSFSYKTVLHIGKKNYAKENLDKILFVANSGIYEQVQKKIDRYAYDIHLAYGCEIDLVSVSGGSDVQIKNLIKNYQSGLDGTVFIGDIIASWYEETYASKYAAWPCDLYYMDLDGTWEDLGENGIYDSHTGDVKPEIFVGRISTANMGNLVSEKEGMEKYLDKNHAFWNGQTTIDKKYSLAYIDADWSGRSQHRTGIQSLYGMENGDVVAYGDASFGKKDYLDRLKSERYEFVQLSCHSNSSYHGMSGGSISSTEIFSTDIKASGCNLFCCMACDWTDFSQTGGFLAGAYLYGSSSSVLSLVGSTKSGSMLNFPAFYDILGQGKSMGESLKTWWINAFGNVHDSYRIHWHYGMSILGDPLINFFRMAEQVCSDNVVITSKNLTGDATHYYFSANKKIEVKNVTIPIGKHVIFNAPNVVLGGGFTCEAGGSFEIFTEGCK